MSARVKKRERDRERELFVSHTGLLSSSRFYKEEEEEEERRMKYTQTQFSTYSCKSGCFLKKVKNETKVKFQFAFKRLLFFLSFVR